MEGLLQLKKVVHHLRQQLYALGIRLSWVESGVGSLTTAHTDVYVPNTAKTLWYKLTAVGVDGSSMTLDLEQVGVAAPDTGVVIVGAINVETGVDNFDALRALGVHNNRQRISVFGASDAGDGGGGEFYYDPAWVGPDDGGSVIKPTDVGGANGAWIRYL